MTMGFWVLQDAPPERQRLRATAKKPKPPPKPAEKPKAAGLPDADAHLTLLGRHGAAKVAAGRLAYAERHPKR
jgi:hypothetical protein